jgi:(R,R)-butanediol dehydrogenase / meso-butanediol dehydrogenase / diacetyl reductase
MRAVVYTGIERLEERSVPVPTPEDHDVLVHVAYCGVCGTDLHIVFGDGGWGVPGSIYGHEWSGDIVAVGAAVERWRIGDRVVGPASGGFAEFLAADEGTLHPVPPGMDLRTAALTEPLAVALHGVTRSGATAADRVLITGGGPIGLLTLAVLQAPGLRDVTVSEPAPGRHAAITRLGGTATTPGDLESVASYVDLVPEPYDIVIECSGTVAATTQGLTQLRPGGRLVIVGSTFATVPLDPLRVLVQESEIVGSREYDEHGFADALALLSDEAFPVTLLLAASDTTFEGLLPLLHDMQRGAVAGKPLVVSA